MQIPDRPARLARARDAIALLRDPARGLLVILMVATAFSGVSIAAFHAICARAERLEARAADDQMDRVAFSRRHGPRVAAGSE